MIIKSNSFLRRPSTKIHPEQIIVINAIKYSVDICEMAFNRLEKNLYEFQEQCYDGKFIALIFSDVWTIINNGAILKKIICNNFNISNSDPLFGILSKLKGLRDTNQHIEERAFQSYNYPKLKDQPQYSRNIVINTDFPTNSTIELNHYAQVGLKAIFREGYHYKKAGVIVMGLTPNNETQLSLFNTSNPKHQPLMSVIDKMNKSYGTNKVKFANQSLGRQWKMKQEKLSKSFTTRIDEIITIKI